MEINELRRGLKFDDPDASVSVRHRDNWRWQPAEIHITNIRRYSEDPQEIVVYYRDNGGNRYKADAEWFLSRYGDFVKEAVYAPATPAEPDMTDPNPAAIPNACPGCGAVIDRPMYYGAEGYEHADKYTCPKCGTVVDLSTSANDEFLAQPEFFLGGSKRLALHFSAVKKLLEGR